MKQSIKYLILISRAKIREKYNPLTKDFEIHHIVPKCCGGKNVAENLVKLTYQEHYRAHKELAESNPKHDGLQMAWSKLAVSNKKILTEDEFAIARKAGREALSRTLKGKPAPQVAKANSERIWTEEMRETQRKKSTGRICSEETREKRRNQKQCKKTINIDDFSIFRSASETARFYNVDVKTITNMCNGIRQQTDSGLRIRWLENYLEEKEK